MPTKNSLMPANPDPGKRLAAAIVIQAVRDLRSKDTIAALDALLWIIEGDAEIYLTALDILPSGDLLQQAVSNES